MPIQVAIPQRAHADYFYDIILALSKAGLDYNYRDNKLGRGEAVSSYRAKTFPHRAIPTLIHLEKYEAGFCSKHVLEEYGYDSLVTLLKIVPEHNSEMIVAGLPGVWDNRKAPRLLLATPFERTAIRWARNRNISCDIFNTGGTARGFAPNFADLVIDQVLAGTDLFWEDIMPPLTKNGLANDGLVIHQTISQDSIYLVAHRRFMDLPEVVVLRERLADIVKN